MAKHLKIITDLTRLASAKSHPDELPPAVTPGPVLTEILVLERFSFKYSHALALFFLQTVLQQAVRITGYGPVVAPCLTKKFQTTPVNI